MNNETQTRILDTFDELDAETGRRNYVTLFDLRRRLTDLSRAEFDAAINELRRAWKLTLDPADGRHVRVSDEVRDAGIVEESQRLVYAARREA